MMKKKSKPVLFTTEMMGSSAESPSV